MKKEKFITHPFFAGGAKALEKKIVENLQYPKEALTHKKEGTVSLKYDIDLKGHVIATRIVASVGYGCDEEAVRLVKLLRFVVPQQPKGLKVIFHKEIHIHFRLPKVTPKVIEQPMIPLSASQNDTPQYSYHYKTKPPKISPKSVNSSGKSFQIVVKYVNI